MATDKHAHIKRGVKLISYKLTLIITHSVNVDPLIAEILL